MKTAEQWADEMYPHAGRRDLLILEYRQIQADALRWAMDQIKNDVNTAGSRSIRDQANQLDPQPTKP